MDFLQEGRRGRGMRCYSAQARIREDPELIATLRFYRAPPGAQVFPGTHAFGSNVWEIGDWDPPRPGLGFLDFNFSAWDNGDAPPGVTGQGTPTPLDWFLNGVPAGVIGPYPNGRCTPTGELFRLNILLTVRPQMGQGTLPAAGLQNALLSLRPCLNQWQVMLFTSPATVSSTTTLSQLTEATYPGYARQNPSWNTTAQQLDGSSLTSSLPLSFARGNGPGSVQVFGWALVSPFSGQLIAAATFAAGPITLANPGDSVYIQPITLGLTPSPPRAAGVAAGVGSVGGVAVASRRVTGAALGVGALAAFAATPGHALGLGRGSGSASGTSNAPPTRGGTATGSGSASGSSNAPVNKLGTAVGSGSVSGTSSSTGPKTGTAAGKGSGSATRRGEVVPGCASCTNTPYQVTVNFAGVTNGSCTDCANLNATWTLTYGGSCTWTSPTFTLCATPGLTISLHNAGGNTWQLLVAGRGSYTVTLGSTWTGRSALTLTLASFTGCSTMPATVTVNPV